MAVFTEEQNEVGDKIYLHGLWYRVCHVKLVDGGMIIGLRRV